jgi:hypothetical protein
MGSTLLKAADVLSQWGSRRRLFELHFRQPVSEKVDLWHDKSYADWSGIAKGPETGPRIRGLAAQAFLRVRAHLRPAAAAIPSINNQGRST